jgi:hypothetical protein
MHGIITRYNKKTVSVITDDGRRWTVSPGLLQPAQSSDDEGSNRKNVTPGRALGSGSR